VSKYPSLETRLRTRPFPPILLFAPLHRFIHISVPMTTTAPKKQDEWLKALNELPASPKNIPAFFFAHSSPIMELEVPNMPMAKNGALPLFLKDFGDVLLKKYQPKAVVVFSAHWHNDGEILGTRRSYFSLAIFAHIHGRSCQ
jgi:hypothetical protein